MNDRAKMVLEGGFACSKCKKSHKFPPYVYAHWDDVLTHTCDCGQKHDLRRGKTRPTKS